MVCFIQNNILTLFLFPTVHTPNDAYSRCQENCTTDEYYYGDYTILIKCCKKFDFCNDIAVPSDEWSWRTFRLSYGFVQSSSSYFFQINSNKCFFYPAERVIWYAQRGKYAGHTLILQNSFLTFSCLNTSMSCQGDHIFIPDPWWVLWEQLSQIADIWLIVLYRDFLKLSWGE